MGRSINVTLIFSLERYAAVAEAHIRGLERLVAGGGDPTKVASWRASSSRVDTEADRRLDELGGQATRLKGKLAIANASSPTGTGRRRRRAALGVLRRQGRERAALPLGVDVDEEPRVPGRDVRRGADRPEDREHDAGRDRGGLPGARQGRADDHRGRRRRRGSCWSGSRRSGSTTTTSSRRSRPRACRSSPTPSRSCWTDPRQASPARGSVTSIVERIWNYDASLWTDSGEDRWLGWLDVVSGCGSRRRAERVPWRPPASSSTTSSCSAWAAPRSPPR